MSSYQYKTLEIAYLRDASMPHAEVARRLSVSVETVKRWRKKRRIQRVRQYQQVHHTILELCEHYSIREVSRQSGISRSVITRALEWSKTNACDTE